MNWDEIQELINDGKVIIVLPLIHKFFQENLTDKQLEDFGDLSFLNEYLTDNKSVKKSIEFLIRGAKEGFIKDKP